MRAFLLSMLAICIAGAILFYVRDQHRQSVIHEMNAATSAAYLAAERIDLDPHTGCKEESSPGGAEWIRRKIDAEVAVKKAQAELGGPTDETLLGDEAMLNYAIILQHKQESCLKYAYALLAARSRR